MVTDNPNIIIGGGFGSSGLSALMDLLREVDSYYVMPQEFVMFDDPDGLISMESALVDNWSIFQSDVAIRRFKKLAHCLEKKFRGPYTGLDYSRVFGGDFNRIVEEYIDNLLYFSFRGLWYGIDSLIKRQLNYRLKKLFCRSKLTTTKMFVAKNLTESEFIEFTRQFIVDLANTCLRKHNKTTFVIDEGFVSLCPTKILRYLPPSGKIIVVIRDPRDVYAESKITHEAWTFQPDDVERFVKYHIAMFKRWVDQKQSTSKEKVMELKFDELVLKYDKTVPRIFEFLHIDPKLHRRKKTILDPEISKKNVGLWQKILSREEMEFFKQNMKQILQNYGWS